MARWTMSSIIELPVVSDFEPEDPIWHPLQHALGIDTFGANVFVARHSDQLLVEEHDEGGSGQQELYLLLEGSALFELDGEEVRLDRGRRPRRHGPRRRAQRRRVDRRNDAAHRRCPSRQVRVVVDPTHFADIPRPE